MHQSENVWQIIYWLQFYVHFGCMFLHLTGLQKFLTVVYRMVSTFCNWHCRPWWRFWSWCRGMLLNWLMVNCCIFVVLQFYRCTYTHTHPLVNGPLSGTTRVSRYQKGKSNLDFTEARDSEWQWHQLGYMQICTLLQTNNHASTPPLSFLQAGCPSCRPTNSVKALKASVYLSQCK